MALDHLLSEILRVGSFDGTPHPFVDAIKAHEIYDIVIMLSITDDEWKGMGYVMPFAIKKKLDFARAWIKSLEEEAKVYSVDEIMSQMGHRDYSDFCRKCSTRQVKSCQEIEIPEKVDFVEPIDEEEAMELPPAGVKSRRSSLLRARASLGSKNPNVNPRRGS